MPKLKAALEQRGLGIDGKRADLEKRLLDSLGSAVEEPSAGQKRARDAEGASGPALDTAVSPDQQLAGETAEPITLAATGTLPSFEASAAPAVRQPTFDSAVAAAAAAVGEPSAAGEPSKSEPHEHVLTLMDPLAAYPEGGGQFMCDACETQFGLALEPGDEICNLDPVYHCQQPGCTYDECLACYARRQASAAAERTAKRQRAVKRDGSLLLELTNELLELVVHLAARQPIFVVPPRIPFADVLPAAQSLAERARHPVDALLRLGATCTRLRVATALEITKRATARGIDMPKDLPMVLEMSPLSGMVVLKSASGRPCPMIALTTTSAGMARVQEA